VVMSISSDYNRKTEIDILMYKKARAYEEWKLSLS